MTDPMTAGGTLLVSPAAPKTVTSPLELDGYLTGVIITPQATPISPRRWLPGLWADDETLSDDEAQLDFVLRAVRDRYNALVNDIERSLQRLETDRICDYRPMFMPREGKPPHDAVRRWARGFCKAMTLIPPIWSALAEDERATSSPSSTSSMSMTTRNRSRCLTISTPSSTKAPPRSRKRSSFYTSSQKCAAQYKRCCGRN